MKVLSLLQPWATLVAIGAKQIETRSWLTHYRGPLAIAASKGFPPKLRVLCHDSPFYEALIWTPPAVDPDDLIRTRIVVRPLPLGSILCVCELVDCMQIRPYNLPPEPERSFGNYSTHQPRYAWYLENVRVLPKPIPAKGARGLWTPAPDVLEQLERCYREGVT